MRAGFLNSQKVNYHLECSAGYNPVDGDKWLCFAVSQSREAKHSKIFTRTHLVITAWRELSIPNQTHLNNIIRVFKKAAGRCVSSELKLCKVSLDL